MKHPDLNVHHFTQNEESKFGADWEWWVGSDRQGWACLRIQAKRVRGHSYPELAHAGGEDKFQYDVLIDGCDPFKSEFPLHVFYNGWPKNEFLPGSYWADPAIWSACPNFVPPERCHHAEPRDYGCAIVSSLAVKATHESQTPANGALNRRVTAHLSNALPWSYLWGVPNPRPSAARPRSSGRGNDWHKILTKALRSIYSQALRQEQVRRNESRPNLTEAELLLLNALAPDSGRRLQPQLPSWAQAVRLKSRQPGRLLDLPRAPARLVVVADFTPAEER